MGRPSPSGSSKVARTVDRVGAFRPIARDATRDYILEMLLTHATADLSYEECVGVTNHEVHDDLHGVVARVIHRSQHRTPCHAVAYRGSDYTASVGSPTELSVNERIIADLAASSVVVVRG